MPDYTKSQIYELWHESRPDNKIVDATTQRLLCHRLSGYRAEYKRAPGAAVFVEMKAPSVFTSRWAEGLRIRLLERYRCGSRAELMWRVAHWRKKASDNAVAAAAATYEPVISHTLDAAVEDMKDCVAALSY